MIRGLLYLTTSRTDITFEVEVCARYQAKPKAKNQNQVKRIMKYINGTYDYGILYSHDIISILVGYCDADWAGNVDDRKRTSGGYFFLSNNLISWFSKNIIVSHYLLQKLSTLLQGAVLPNYFGTTHCCRC